MLKSANKYISVKLHIGHIVASKILRVTRHLPIIRSNVTPYSMLYSSVGSSLPSVHSNHLFCRCHERKGGQRCLVMLSGSSGRHLS